MEKLPDPAEVTSTILVDASRAVPEPFRTPGHGPGKEPTAGWRRCLKSGKVSRHL
jgi:hypothetical protein